MENSQLLINLYTEWNLAVVVVVFFRRECDDDGERVRDTNRISHHIGLVIINSTQSVVHPMQVSIFPILSFERSSERERWEGGGRARSLCVGINYRKFTFFDGICNAQMTIKTGITWKKRRKHGVCEPFYQLIFLYPECVIVCSSDCMQDRVRMCVYVCLCN